MLEVSLKCDDLWAMTGKNDQIIVMMTPKGPGSILERDTKDLLAQFNIVPLYAVISMKVTGDSIVRFSVSVSVLTYNYSEEIVKMEDEIGELP